MYQIIHNTRAYNLLGRKELQSLYVDCKKSTTGGKIGQKLSKSCKRNSRTKTRNLSTLAVQNGVFYDYGPSQPDLK